jgi:hypothetical protein
MHLDCVHTQESFGGIDLTTTHGELEYRVAKTLIVNPKEKL